jgi:hypothetical protein
VARGKRQCDAAHPMCALQRDLRTNLLRLHDCARSREAVTLNKWGTVPSRGPARHRAATRIPPRALICFSSTPSISFAANSVISRFEGPASIDLLSGNQLCSRLRDAVGCAILSSVGSLFFLNHPAPRVNSGCARGPDRGARCSGVRGPDLTDWGSRRRFLETVNGQ